MKILKKVKNIPKRISRKIESYIYRKGLYKGKINILSPKETEQFLVSFDGSFCRFGDGEIAIMQGEDIAFQKYDSMLAERLKGILSTKENGLAIGVNYVYLNPVNDVNNYTQSFLDSMAMQRRFMLNNCSRDFQYFDAGITQLYQNYCGYDFRRHFAMMQSMFEGNEIAVVCGENVLKQIKYNAFDVCKSVEYLFMPGKNAFEKYDLILEKVLKINSKKIICVILGPTAKVLVYDLYKRGRKAWDMGHYLKDYDSYMRKQVITDESIQNFFKPD